MPDKIHIYPMEVLMFRKCLTPGTSELVQKVAAAYRCTFATEEQTAVFYEMLGAIFHAGEISGKRAERQRPKYDAELWAYYLAEKEGQGNDHKNRNRPVDGYALAH